MVDPRTNLEITVFADCHLIPASFGVSNVTVRLDADVDSKIGAFCDSALPRYLDTLFGTTIEGKLAIEGGAQRLTAICYAAKGTFLIPKPASVTAADFARRALNIDSGPVRWEGFHGGVVDGCAAYISMIHSAFLLLYKNGTPDLSDTAFDWVRGLIGKVLGGTIENADWDFVRDLVTFSIAVACDRVSKPEVTLDELRTLYDPTCDAGDGIYDSFPSKSFHESDDAWLVTLPYSRSLRAEVTFTKHSP